LEDLKVVINGAGAAGIAIARLLRCINFDPNLCIPVKEVIICDSKGIIHKDRAGLTSIKQELLTYSNPNNQQGSIQDALVGADVFIGVSVGNLITAADVKNMADDSIIFAMANPIPEIMPDVAKAAGAAIVGTGRSDFANQINNVLAFPGVFKGALDAKATCISPKMKLAAAYALADCLEVPSFEKVLPDTLNKNVVGKVSKAVAEAYETPSEVI